MLGGSPGFLAKENFGTTFFSLLCNIQTDFPYSTIKKKNKTTTTATMPPKKIKPNEKCHCGSGKKHKKCCMHQRSGGTTTAAADSAVSSAPVDLIPVAKQNVATSFIEDIDGYNTTLIEVMDELSLTASSTVAAAAASASDIGGRCFHGSTFDHFPDGRAYRDIIRDFFAVTTKNFPGTNFPDCPAAAEKFTANHHEYFTDSNFFRYIFALCTSWQLKTKRTPVEMKVLILLTIAFKYLYPPLKMKRYIRAIMHEDDRGVINCLAKETKPYCNCMKDQKISFAIMASSSESNLPPSQEGTKSQIPSSVSQECEPESSRPECPICFHVLPLQRSESVYHSCCGQVICHGCVVGTQRTQLKEPQPQFKELGRIIEGTTPEEEQFWRIKKYGRHIYVCPYCRAPFPKDGEEALQRLYARIEIRNHDYTEAVNILGRCYMEGKYGLPQNFTKAEELFKKALDLDDPQAASNLYHLYHQHYPDQKEKAMEYLVRGEQFGHLQCMKILALEALRSDNVEEATRLSVKLARLGEWEDTRDLLMFYQHKLLSKDVLASTLRANQSVKDEVKTKRRDFAKRFMEFCDRS